MDLIQENKKRWSAVERVAWLRVGALGDLLVGLASLVETHEFFPNAKVTVIGPKLWCEILSPQEYPWVARIVVIEKKAQVGREYRAVGEKWAETEDGAVKPLLAIFRESQAFVNTNIDSYRYGFTALRARTPIRVGSASSTMAWLYTHASPFFGKDPLIHERDAALLLLEYAEGSGIKFFRSTDRNRVNLSEWVGRSRLVMKWKRLGLPQGKAPDLARARELTAREPGSYLLVNPTSSRREKAWPSTMFHELMLRARASLEERGIEILVLGAPHETEWLREVARKDFRVVQPPTVRDLQDVLSGSRGLLTNTSSVQFISAMSGTPTITLMGRARPEIWGPLGPNDRVILGKPPAELAHDIFKQEEGGYRAIDVETVLNSLITLPLRERVR